ncbi:PPOX class F420-dependent oxidoreductase [Nocardia sp. KC 131]|uniref:PPOX class F420-dependent oxidoreductase n=1 Tax=Nocardia arseniciresistens TaxID=3392119 RepID=UPI00398F8A85
MGITLSEATIALLDGKNYAVLATLNADGSPQSSAMWVGRDGNDLVFSTLEGRLKYRNIVRDPRVSVTVIDSADGEYYVELRGNATITADPDLHIGHELSWKYEGKDHSEPEPGQTRVAIRVEVVKATGYAA